MNTTDPFRDRVRREAIANGWPADAAAALARHVGKRPPTSTPPTPAPRGFATRAQHAPGTPSPRNVNVDRLCALYGAAALAPDFKRANGSLRSFAALLDAAVGSRAKITPAGIEHVRIALMAAARGAA